VPRTCIVCKHAQRGEIDRALVDNESTETLIHTAFSQVIRSLTAFVFLVLLSVDIPEKWVLREER
jgi:hypothetical protein